MTKCILLVNADGLLRRSLAEQLTSHGFGVAEADSAEACLTRAVEAEPDLVVMDGHLADMAPVRLCAALRDNGVTCPIIVLGADGAEALAVRASGASDCMAKPFRFASLVQRLQAQLRDRPRDDAIELGGYRFHPLARVMIDHAGRQVRLTEKETAILVYLQRAGARVVTREELLGEVWGYANSATTHTVETHIYRLRRKLEGAGGEIPLLCTENGGYRLAG